MPSNPLILRAAAIVAIMSCLSGAIATVTMAQTQEPKPILSPTPAQAEEQSSAATTSGVVGAAWTGPNWGVQVAWDPAIWSVEDEYIQTGYDGLQLGAANSTVFIEAYDGFSGDAPACLDAAAGEISNREGVTEAAPLSGRPLPVPDDARGAAQLFGVTAKLADGSPYRGIEYVECRTAAPGTAVLELTWQAPVNAYLQDLPKVSDLLAAIVVPSAPPAATPGPALATPVA
ncbi:MAG: hypothetical protein U0031_05335 [Thermomicrobiales bacterium]